MPRYATGESVVERTVRLLEAFRTPETTLPVAELARRAGVPPSTASRLIRQLAAAGLLVRHPDHSVGLGMRLWELGTRASPALSLREAAMPLMEDLHAVVGQHLQLGVRHGDDILYVEQLTAPGAIPTFARIAGRRPLAASSGGLVLLASTSVEAQERVLAALRPGTQPDPARLRHILADIRRDGYVVTPGHVVPDVCGVAVPVLGTGDDLVAALSLVVPRSMDVWSRIPALQSAARGITRRLRETRRRDGPPGASNAPPSPSEQGGELP